jgi:glycosyltransferase involved in cell wall biosynthesis
MISVLTATYNRGYILNKLYDSLNRQSSTDFEWIIVDDGSKDDTNQIVKTWIANANRYPIKYMYKQNGGKHKAINLAVQMASSDYCVIVDSDDFLTDDAVQKIHFWISSLKLETNFAGVAGLKGYISGGIIGKYPKQHKYSQFIDASNLERRKFRLVGDKAEVYRTDLLKEYPFPEFENENFMSEEVVWDKIASRGYKIRWYNDIIVRCQYLEDGLSHGTNHFLVKNYNGYTYATKEKIKLHGLYEKQIIIGEYYLISKQKKLKLSEIADNLKISQLNLSFALLICGIRNSIKILIKHFV